MSNMIPCPFCGEEIDKKAKSCRYCGSDENTGWSETGYEDSMGPDEGFDYDEMVNSEFGEENVHKKSKKAILIKTASIILLVLFILFIIKGLL